jgi:hypothetical protein
MKRIQRLISLSDTPVVLAVLLAALAWLATGVVTRQLEEPILEHSEEWLSGKDSETAFPTWKPSLINCFTTDRRPRDHRLLLVTLENLSRTVRLDDVTLAVSIESGASLLRLADRAIAPGIAGTSEPACDEVNGEVGPFSMHPGGVHQLMVEVDGKEVPVLRLVHSSVAINLVRSSLRTFLVKNYTALATFTALLFVLLVVAYLVALDKVRNQRSSEARKP